MGTEDRGAGWQVESSRRLDAAGGELGCTNEGGGGTAARVGDGGGVGGPGGEGEEEAMWSLGPSRGPPPPPAA